MNTLNPANNGQLNDRTTHLMAEKIYRSLNQGNLFEIYLILESLENKEKKYALERIFLDKYNFNFTQYI